MSVVAVYNMKGGVGKTTAAVNLSYLAAAAGQRTLLWDLDSQGAASFAFRIRPRVAGFGKKILESSQALAEAIKETDYPNLDLLPADFAYRKLDRLLDHLGKPTRVVTTILDRIGRDYDTVFLDCPAGFSRLTEGVIAAADVVLVPTIPTVLSLRMVARILKWADRTNSPTELAAFFSMVDRRKALHRRACDGPADRPDVFLTGQVPYASVVEQMSVRRMPLAVFAARDAATTAFAEIWTELQARLQRRREGSPWPRDKWVPPLQAIESLIMRMEGVEQREIGASCRTQAVDIDTARRAGVQHGVGRPQSPAATCDPGFGPAFKEDTPAEGDVHFVHSFDTDGRDLERGGYVLELRERTGSLQVVVARSDGDDRVGANKRAHAQIDRSWAMEILAGAMSPLAALERRLGTPTPQLVVSVASIVGKRKLRRNRSWVAEPAGTENSTRALESGRVLRYSTTDRVAASAPVQLSRQTQYG